MCQVGPHRLILHFDIPLMFPRRARRITRVHLLLQLSALLASSLAAAFLNLSFATLRRSGGLVSLERMLLSLSGTVVTLLLIHLFLSLGILAVYRGLGRFRFVPLLVWGGTTVVLIAAITPVWDLLSESLPIGGWAPAELLMTVGAVWSMVFTLPVFGYMLARYWRNNRRAAHFFQGFLVSAPLLGLETFFFVWAEVFWISGMLSPQSLMWSTVYLVAVLLTLAAGSWIGQHLPPLPVLALVTLVIVLAPFVQGAFGQATTWRTTETPGPVAQANPCVILLTVDTLRADALAPYAENVGNGWGTSAPAFEALAADSTVFLSARSPSPWTKPSTASILTGVAPGVHGTTDLRSILPEEIETLAETLSDAGYRTAGIGRNTFLRDAFNFDQGFDEYQFFPRGNGGILGARMLQALFPHHFATAPSSEELADFAIEWLRRNQNDPFFLWLHFFDPHGPFAPPRRFLPAGRAASRIGTTFADTAAIRDGELVPDLEEREWIRELYRAEIRYVSDEVGRVTRALEDLGLYDQCLIVFTSDHGEEFWEHGGFEHGHTLYDELLRVPLSFKLPHASREADVGIPTGTADPSHQTLDVSTESITPTVLDLLGIDTPSSRFTSPSLAPWILGTAQRSGPASPIFAGAVHYYEDEEAVLFDRVKFIRVPLTGHEEVYALDHDPSETHPLVDNEAVAVGRVLLEEQNRRVETLRRRLGIGGEHDAELDSETLQDLRSLGYID